MIVVSFTILLCASTIKAHFTLPEIDAVSIEGGGMIALAQQWPKLWLLTQIYKKPLSSIFQNQIPVTSCSGGSWFVDAIIFDNDVAHSFDANVDTPEEFMEAYKRYFKRTSKYSYGLDPAYLYKVLTSNGWKEYNEFLAKDYNEVLLGDLNFSWNCEAALKTVGQRGPGTTQTYEISQDSDTEELFDKTGDSLLSIPIIQKAEIKNNTYTAQDTEVVAKKDDFSVTIKSLYWSWVRRSWWRWSFEPRWSNSEHVIPKSHFANAVKNEYTANLQHHAAASTNYIAGQLMIETFSGYIERFMKWAVAHSSCYATVEDDNGGTFQATVLDCGLYDYKALIPNVRDIQANGTLLLLKKEDLSSITDWYATPGSPRKMYVFDVNSEDIVGTYPGIHHTFNIWKWRVTTVQNDFWNIAAGKQFDIIIPHLAWKDKDLCEGEPIMMGTDYDGILECGNAFMSTYPNKRELYEYEADLRDV